MPSVAHMNGTQLAHLHDVLCAHGLQGIPNLPACTCGCQHTVHNLDCMRDKWTIRCIKCDRTVEASDPKFACQKWAQSCEK